jgi:hypothetical protein
MQSISPIHVFHYPDAASFNPVAVQAIAALSAEDFRHRSHFIAGRYENLYLDRERIPGLAALLDYALHQAAGVLGEAVSALRCGFWLNRMAPGDHTSRHAHAENDERLSGVYYLQAPTDSGDLLFDDPPFEIRLAPQAGMGLLFDPEQPHWVETHRGVGERLSLAFNIGSASD